MGRQTFTPDSRQIETAIAIIRQRPGIDYDRIAVATGIPRRTQKLAALVQTLLDAGQVRTCCSLFAGKGQPYKLYPIDHPIDKPLFQHAKNRTDTCTVSTIPPEQFAQISKPAIQAQSKINNEEPMSNAIERHLQRYTQSNTPAKSSQQKRTKKALSEAEQLKQTIAELEQCNRELRQQITELTSAPPSEEKPAAILPPTEWLKMQREMDHQSLLRINQRIKELNDQIRELDDDRALLLNNLEFFNLLIERVEEIAPLKPAASGNGKHLELAV